MSEATSSSEYPLRALDTMLMVYALLDSHPATVACEEFIKQKEGWFTSVLHLFEAYSVLTKVYGVQPVDAERAIDNLANSPL